jgi:hypothetical protein
MYLYGCHYLYVGCGLYLDHPGWGIVNKIHIYALQNTVFCLIVMRLIYNTHRAVEGVARTRFPADIVLMAVAGTAPAVTGTAPAAVICTAAGAASTAVRVGDEADGWVRVGGGVECHVSGVNAIVVPLRHLRHT